MTPERWQRVEEVFRATLAQPAELRAGFVEQACEDDEVRREVRSLLRARDGVPVTPAWPASADFPAGARFGPYEIVGPIAAGGMGVVHRARDTRVDRMVAIKVCREPLSGRFEREARAIAALNHPHVCALYDVGRQDGVDYLVMEHIEGESLAERLARGPLPRREALRCAIEIAGALAAAHARGIVHRDLKPGNIMLARCGVKVLDFGLAKMPAAAAAMGETVTREGTVLGTPEYMSPEQIQGKEIDARSDIFSFGLILYEMWTGRRAFTGESAASVMAAILQGETPRAPDMPAELDRLLRLCLAKDPADRWHSAHDLRIELEWIAGPQPAGGTRGRRRVAVWAAAGAALGAMAAFVAFRNPAPDPRVIRMQITYPKVTAREDAAVSPDGTRIAFTQPAGNLMVRPLDSLATVELPGTAGAVGPFWSPDGKYIGYGAGFKLYKVPVAGGPPTVLDEGTSGPGVAWSRSGTILIGSAIGGLTRIPAEGGKKLPVTALDDAKGETAHTWPSFLPDDRHFIFTVLARDTHNGGVFLGSLDSPSKTRLLPEPTRARYTEPGYLLFSRGSTLMAQPFDPRRLRATGEAFAVAPQAQEVTTAPIWFSAGGGVLLYRVGGAAGLKRLKIFDRHGGAAGEIGEPGEYWEPAVSPDGRSIAVSLGFGDSDIWVFDLKRGTSSRVTFGPAGHGNPDWSPDSREVVYDVLNRAGWTVERAPVNGTGAPQKVLSLELGYRLSQWTADGKYLIHRSPAAAGSQIVATPLAGGPGSVVVAGSAFSPRYARVSGDGKWIAYTSNETGAPEVYVQDFPEHRQKWRISTSGGTNPRWRSDGRELFYREKTKVMAVDIRAKGGSLEAGLPKLLFDAPDTDMSYGPFFDVSPDGQKFYLVTVNRDVASLPAFAVVVNWPAAVKR